MPEPTKSGEFKNGGDAILDVLAQYGIDYLFTSPIAALAPLWEAFAKRRRDQPESIPQYVNCRHELLAVSAAIGHYKSTGKPAAVCLPTGLGVLNGSMALRTAKQEQIPMLIISPDTTSFGQTDTADPGPEWPPFLIDEFGPAQHAATTTKWSVACRTPKDLYPNLHRAIYFSQQIARGPVMVEVPFEVMMARFDAEDSPQNRFPALTSDVTVASAGQLSDVSQIIASAENPIIITESFGSSPTAIALLDQFAHAIAAPVFEWFIPGHANFDRSSPLHGKGELESVLDQADVVIAICTNGPWHPPNTKLKTGCQVIAIEQAPVRPTAAFWGYETTVCISGDPVANL
ncbi:MAG: thiamine pyrophosphate-binding protein, partial [Pirellulaceae bacterium]|nr:thiamine pyrophosphate-binding protein [Pirellulaceae bacterium]